MKKCMCCMRNYEDHEPKCPFCGYSDADVRMDREEYPEAIAGGTVLAGRYILGRVLSITDFSIVYIGWDALLQMRVAIREYLPFGLGERDAAKEQILFAGEQQRILFARGRDLFEQEGAVLHRNQDVEGILSVFRILRERGTSYLVTGYIEGVTLQDRLEERGGFPMSERISMLRELGGIIDAFHERGIIHYNLSPDNVYIDSTGRLKVIDFGSAKREVCRMTQMKTNILDPRYTAPEVMDAGSSGPTADAYSFGAILYRMTEEKDPPQSRTRLRKRDGLVVRSGTPYRKLIEWFTIPAPEKRPACVMDALAQLQ